MARCRLHETVNATARKDDTQTGIIIVHRISYFRPAALMKDEKAHRIIMVIHLETFLPEMFCDILMMILETFGLM
jgi:hypothetical protein